MPALEQTGVDFGFSEELLALRDAVRRLAQDKIAPRAAQIDQSNEFPRDLWPKLGAQGLLGITVPEAYGGAGLGYLAHVIVMEEISRASGAPACPSPTDFASMQKRTASRLLHWDLATLRLASIRPNRQPRAALHWR